MINPADTLYLRDVRRTLWRLHPPEPRPEIPGEAPAASVPRDVPAPMHQPVDSRPADTRRHLLDLCQSDLEGLLTAERGRDADIVAEARVALLARLAELEAAVVRGPVQ
ncbi:MAG TPA: hypothetical protein VF590_26810 [Isosphaeraceae bacterium]|jgi:hypothetical protein